MAVRRLRSSHLLRDDGGAALVEFAIAVPLLFTFAFGIIDFGRAFYVYNALNSIARDGARYGAVLSTLDTAAVRRRIEDVIAPQYLGGLSASKQLAGAGAQIAVTTPAACNTGANGCVRVAITNYSFSFWLPVIPEAKGPNGTGMKIGAVAVFRREW